MVTRLLTSTIIFTSTKNCLFQVDICRNKMPNSKTSFFFIPYCYILLILILRKQIDAVGKRLSFCRKPSLFVLVEIQVICYRTNSFSNNYKLRILQKNMETSDNVLLIQRDPENLGTNILTKKLLSKTNNFKIHLNESIEFLALNYA